MLKTVTITRVSSGGLRSHIAVTAANVCVLAPKNDVIGVKVFTFVSLDSSMDVHTKPSPSLRETSLLVHPQCTTQSVF